MHSLRTLRVFLFSGLLLTSFAVRADSPSAGCKEGAEHCKEAFLALEQCQQKKAKEAGQDECASEKVATDQACKNTTSICHKDGSRRPPR